MARERYLGTMRAPHFDLDRVVRSDGYSPCYLPPPRGYSLRFDVRRSLAQRDDAYGRRPGACSDGTYIDDRICERSRSHPNETGFRVPSAGSQQGGLLALAAAGLFFGRRRDEVFPGRDLRMWVVAPFAATARLVLAFLLAGVSPNDPFMFGMIK